ncbi:WD40 repeat-like protein [Basidiobolus meristosporus CBS 931.73]|uniref:WD40 repeat-like protein n=1 Tax=Basidiobolus meristosporus CBS 931.73 TaxID=1314790 RepID=A0A1Y1X980_9FUNG|nr:WD40 repeat-like protein [Basidiobolus meristosporus CBS 931.73]|eukprot:ORX82313.1 WD40 repeat-like protein [Basidiobolus meristosporus CBS 931.73]
MFPSSLDPFENNFPDIIEEVLEDGPTLNCTFNGNGSFLAGGCTDGRCLIWDFETRSLTRKLEGHVKSVSSTSWSRNGRFILTGSEDGRCIYWDLLDTKILHDIDFGVPVLKACIHPRNDSLILVCLFQKAPVLVDLSRDLEQVALPTSMEISDEQADSNNGVDYITEATFNRKGDKIFTGSSRGVLNIIDTATRKIVYSSRATSSGIKHIQLSHKGKDFLVNSNDRVVRMYTLQTEENPQLEHKFQDLVNKIQWNQACFSNDDDYVIGASAHKAEHNIYVWDKNMANLVKILEGPKEPIRDLAWHPKRPIVASVSNYGIVYLWTRSPTESWSAFAPDFKELEENAEYEEREDEFDIVSRENRLACLTKGIRLTRNITNGIQIPDNQNSKLTDLEENIVIDVVTVDKPFSIDSDNEDFEEMFFIPVRPEKDDDVTYFRDADSAAAPPNPEDTRKRKSSEDVLT